MPPPMHAAAVSPALVRRRPRLAGQGCVPRQSGDSPLLAAVGSRQEAPRASPSGPNTQRDVCVRSLGRVRLCATPWTAARQCPPPGDLPDPGIEPESPTAPALQVDSLPRSLWGSPTACQRLPKPCIHQPNAGEGVQDPLHKPRLPSVRVTINTPWGSGPGWLGPGRLGPLPPGLGLAPWGRRRLCLRWALCPPMLADSLPPARCPGAGAAWCGEPSAESSSCRCRLRSSSLT